MLTSGILTSGSPEAIQKPDDLSQFINAPDACEKSSTTFCTCNKLTCEAATYRVVSSANSLSMPAFSTDSAKPLIFTSWEFRCTENASDTNKNRKGASGHPYRTDLEIENRLPISPANKRELCAWRYNVDTPRIHVLGKPILSNVPSIKSQSTLS